MGKGPTTASKGVASAYGNVNRPRNRARFDKERTAGPLVSFCRAGICELLFNTLAVYIQHIGIADDRRNEFAARNRRRRFETFDHGCTGTGE